MAYKKKEDAIAYNNKYIREKMDRINLTMPKGKKEVVQAHAEGRGESTTAFINRAIDQTMERDSAASGPNYPSEGTGTDTAQA